ncbi:MAG: SDR family oxidoreductase [Rubripirellula sp.]
MTTSDSKPHGSPHVSPRTLIFGCGYLGRRVAKQALNAGHRVWATTRNIEKKGPLTQLGIEPILADWTDRRTLCRLPDVDQILVAVSYDRHSNQSRLESQVGGLRNLLEFTPPQTKVCYISTTGVYHQTGGVWVDETSPTRPSREGGKVHLMAEELLHRTRPKSDWTVLRLAGIYGPGRVPRAADVIAGRPISSPKDGFLNLIHVDDAAEAVLATWRGAARRMYVIADDRPSQRSEFYREIARQCRAADPQFVAPDVDAPARMRSESNKRVWNRRMKRELVPRLRYPTYREGLTRILRAET